MPLIVASYLKPCLIYSFSYDFGHIILSGSSSSFHVINSFATKHPRTIWDDYLS